MANKVYSNMAVKLDNAAGTLTAITCSLNQASIQSAMSVLDDTALCDTSQSVLPDQVSAKVNLNGWINSTTDGIFGPLMGNRTSKTKTAQFYNGLKYYRGEVYPENVQMSGAVKNLQTFSASLVFDGAITRTSVGL